MSEKSTKKGRGRPPKHTGESHRWESVGDVNGYINAVNTLGDDYQEMDKKGSSTTNVNSVWGRLAAALSLEKQDENTRKWLKLVWKDNRRDVRKMFYISKIRDIQSTTTCDENINLFQSKLLADDSKPSSIPASEKRSSSSSSSSSPTEASTSTCTSKSRKCKKISPMVTPSTSYLAVAYDEWEKFFDARPDKWELNSNWTDMLNKYLLKLDITCTLIFQYHHVKLPESRKRNSSLFHSVAVCKHRGCPVILVADVKHLPSKNEPAIYYVNKYGNELHTTINKTISRQLKGEERQIQVEKAKSMGALKTYEANVREADPKLLSAGNYSFVPSIDTIRTATSSFNKQHRFDNDPVRDLRIFKHSLDITDKSLEKLKGYIQNIQYTPFSAYCTSSALIQRYYEYHKSVKYSYMHIDATGSVVRKIEKESATFYYVMIYKDGDDPSNMIPFSVALLCDHTTAGISSFLLAIRKFMEIVKKKYRPPSFFVCDFSLAIINALLISFNHEDIYSHLERCWSIIHMKYSISELRSKSIVRLCCAHVMHAFVRSLHEMKLKKDERQNCTKLFAILLNTDTLENAFALIGKIFKIYGDADASDASTLLSDIVHVTNALDFNLEKFLNDEIEHTEETVTPPLKDTFAHSRTIIHGSPFTREARKRFPLLECILKEKKNKNNNNNDNKNGNNNSKNAITNPHYSRNIILKFYRWIAYLPLWTCIMSDYYERYANDKAESLSTSVLGRGCVSNAVAESHFSIVKQSLLQGKLHLRPMDFLSVIYSSILARLTAGKIQLPQTAHQRKLTKDTSGGVSRVDYWKGKGLQKAKHSLRGQHFSTSKTQKKDNKRKRPIQTQITDSFDNKNNSALSVGSYTTNSSIKTTRKKPMRTFDDRDESSDSSINSINLTESDLEEPTKTEYSGEKSMKTFDDRNEVSNSSMGFVKQIRKNGEISVKNEYFENKIMKTFDDPDESSDSSTGFIELPKDYQEKCPENSRLLVSNLSDNQINYVPGASSFGENVIKNILPQEKPVEIKTRPVRQRVPNRKYDSYIIQPNRSNNTTRLGEKQQSSISSINCIRSSESMDKQSRMLASDSTNRKPFTSIENNSKKLKTSYEKNTQSLERFHLASVGNIKLPWPHFNIQSMSFNGKAYTIINTCSIDSVLFVYYFILKSDSGSLRNRFSRGRADAYSIFNKTMELVDTNAWDIARLYWLTANNRLNANTLSSSSPTSEVHDIFGTTNENVFEYLRNMQEHTFSTECSSLDCRKRHQSRTSKEIILNALDDQTFPNFIEGFTVETFASCGVSIGTKKPENYRGQYWIDNNFPVHNLETNEQETPEPMYCCTGPRTISISKFIEIPPVIIVQIQPMMQVFMLPNILHLGNNKYQYRASICGGNNHFTAIIKHKEKYYKFDDLHYKGVFEYDSADFAETAIYSIITEQ